MFVESNKSFCNVGILHIQIHINKTIPIINHRAKLSKMPPIREICHSWCHNQSLWWGLNNVTEFKSCYKLLAARWYMTIIFGKAMCGQRCPVDLVVLDDTRDSKQV